MVAAAGRNQVDYESARDAVFMVDRFNAEYCWTLDGGDLTKWPSLFIQNCFYRVTSIENAEKGLPVGLIYMEGRAMLEDRVTAILHAEMYAPREMRHFVSNTRVLSVAPDKIVSQSNVMVLETLVEGPTTIHLAGQYHDTFVRDQSDLVLESREFVYDNTVIATDLVIPV